MSCSATLTLTSWPGTGRGGLLSNWHALMSRIFYMPIGETVGDVNIDYHDVTRGIQKKVGEYEKLTGVVVSRLAWD